MRWLRLTLLWLFFLFFLVTLAIWLLFLVLIAFLFFLIFLLLILISFSIGQEHRGPVTIAVVIGFTSWVWTARAVRAQRRPRGLAETAVAGRALVEDAAHSFLMGGGIGVTPMIAMAHRLHAPHQPTATSCRGP